MVTEAKNNALVPSVEAQPDAAQAVQLPDELVHAFEDLLKLLTQTTKLLKKKYYKAGQIMLRAIKTGTQKGSGRTAKEVRQLLADALRIDERVLYNAATVAANIEKEEFERICEHEELTWSHIVYLAAIGNPDDRKKLTAETVKNGWSGTQLLETIRERTEKKKRRGSGRPKGVPATPRAAFTRMGKAVRKVRESFDEVWLGEQFDAVVEISGLETHGSVPKGLKEAVEEAIGELEAFQSELPKHVQRMREAKTWIDEALATPDDAIDEAGAPIEDEEQPDTGHDDREDADLLDDNQEEDDDHDE